MNKKTYTISLFIILGLLVTSVISTSYGFYRQNSNQTNELVTGVLDTSFEEKTNSISLYNTYPMNDLEGLKTDPYSFTIRNVGTIDSFYVIYLIDDTNISNNLDRTKIKYSINNGNPLNLKNTKSIDDALSIGRLNVGESITFDLRLWIDEIETSETVSNKIFRASIEVQTVDIDYWNY